jgi:hypothetical protein
MMKRRLVSVLLLLAALPYGLMAKPESTRQLDVTALIRLATVKVTHTKGYAKAALLRATGTTASGNATASAADITQWSFVFDNTATPGATSRGATVSCKAGLLGAVKASPGPGLGVADLKLLPVMTLTRAVALLQKAGYTDAFNSVELFYVLGPNEHPIYEFNFDSTSVVVDTHTGVVEAPTTD